VPADLAVNRWIKHQTGWSIREFRQDHRPVLRHHCRQPLFADLQEALD
jgi:hypothetical protein